MSIMDMNSRMAMAEKLSVQQLQQAVQSGSLPAYIGIPLIEQKTKEKAQMAAAQQGQEKPPSVVASILQQAEQQQQQEQGIDQLPSNLPVQNEEDDENYAGGGIVAFRDGNQVQDPNGRFDEMSTIDRIREEDPELYRRMFPQEGPPLGVNADTRDYSGNAQDGSGIPQPRDYNQRQLMADLPGGRLNVPGINSSTPRERVNESLREETFSSPDSPTSDNQRGILNTLLNRRVGDTVGSVRDSVRSLVDRFKNRNAGEPDLSDTAEAREAEGQTLADRQAIQDRMDIAAANAQDLVSVGRRAIGTVADYGARGINALGGNVPRPDAENTFNRNSGSYTPNRDALISRGETIGPQVLARNAAEAPVQESETIGPQGLRPIQFASSSAQRGAPPPSAASTGTAPSGAVSPATARQISATNPGAPATLKDAERQAANGSPQAAAAVSMVDKYIAMLEKNGDDVGRQKKEALYMALIQGGLATAGGTSPNAFANLAAGMVPAVQSYQQALAGIRKDDRARIEKLINAGMSKEKLGMELRKLGIEEKKVDALVNYYNARAGAAGAGGSGKEDRLADQFAEKTGLDYDRAAQLARRNMTTALANNDDYKRAKMILGMKTAKPADVAAAKKIIQEVEAPYLEDISYNRSMAQRYLNRSSRGGGDAPVTGNMPKGVPQGSKQVGTSGGKPVYESPDGKRYIVE